MQMLRHHPLLGPCRCSNPRQAFTGSHCVQSFRGGFTEGIRASVTETAAHTSDAVQKPNPAAVVFKVPAKIYFKPGCLEVALSELRGKRRALIVTDNTTFDLRYPELITDVLDSINTRHQVFYHVPSSSLPTLSCIQAGMREINDFKPDVIIAVGGISVMEASKVMWAMYENPDLKVEDLARSYTDILSTDHSEFGPSRKSIMIAIPTASGSGAEVSPFAAIMDEVNGSYHTLADHSLVPDVAIVDPLLYDVSCPSAVASDGLVALSQAVESYVSNSASEFSRGMAQEAITILFKFLPRAYADGPNDLEAVEKVHYASTLAGMSLGNASLGICHSLAQSLARCNFPLGPSLASLMCHVIKFNASKSNAVYAELADAMRLEGTSAVMKVEELILAINELKSKVGYDKSLSDIVPEGQKAARVAAKLPTIAAEALNQPWSSCNPNPVTHEELQAILQAAW